MIFYSIGSENLWLQLAQKTDCTCKCCQFEDCWRNSLRPSPVCTFRCHGLCNRREPQQPAHPAMLQMWTKRCWLFSSNCQHYTSTNRKSCLFSLFYIIQLHSKQSENLVKFPDLPNWPVSKSQQISTFWGFSSIVPPSINVAQTCFTCGVGNAALAFSVSEFNSFILKILGFCMSGLIWDDHLLLIIETTRCDAVV